MLVAFSGWPDAAEAATRALRYLVRNLQATKFAEIDPEEFYDFTVVRPHLRKNKARKPTVHWPANDFYHHTPDGDAARGLVVYLGTEPSLRWRAFSNVLLDVIDRMGVRRIVSLGALLAAVPHTRETPVTGRGSSEALSEKLEWLGVKDTGYEGPVGIHTAFMEECVERGLEYVSIWAHCPHYVTTSPNPKASYVLLTKLRGLVDFDVDLDELRLAGGAFDEQVTKSIAKQGDVTSYVQQLERQYDARQSDESEIPAPEAMVEELERFLKRGQRSAGDGDES